VSKRSIPILWQQPNLPIIVWAVATVLSKLVAHGKLHDFLTLVAFGAIFTWAWLETFSGINNFRRGLGIVVLIISLYSRLN
jgi:hypothetical protein